MTPDNINSVLGQRFGDRLTQVNPTSWQINQDELRLLVLLSEDQSWLIALVTIAPLPEAQPFLEEILNANFETTQETRYALHQGVLWGVYRHRLDSLLEAEFTDAIAHLLELQEQGLDRFFQAQVEKQIRAIIQASKAQGQTLETTLQTLTRFYEEGIMGELSQNAAQRERILGAWRAQLERLWPEVNG
ncbi:CesT family type III secretion system chaperone [Roseofilum casamattae]|uniref:CesT family type III secretion system chaperone n=1 Tax=Roseofilum casamattae BLCC-M143 TaxID=3022442 RepID=A0ABT7BXK2_9CYAN|nr:CesT family type III secretion system chaperone [Roseofilum casamattae]MDJ1183915.1 CesT family type III secretion system chaperone [Roseofilum casamattae BLCC-M143]